MIPPGSTIGILGGGQLGRMTALAARRMGYGIRVFDPAPCGPASAVADAEVNGAYDEAAALETFAKGLDVVTFEFENVLPDAAEILTRNAPVRPSPSVLTVCRNREREKTFLADNGYPCPRFGFASSANELESAATEIGFPCVVKTVEGGYDGKGQCRMTAAGEAEEVWNTLGASRVIVEQWVDFVLELSVIAFRNPSGQVGSFPAAENIHRNHILDASLVPGRFSPQVARDAGIMAQAIAEDLQLEGLIAVEFFLSRDGALLVNELAPRPHNSGHYSFDACLTSQFEQHVRAVCDLPLGSCDLLRPVVMVNLLGDLWNGFPPNWSPILSHPSAKLHLYGKKEARPGRKMGHFCVLADTLDNALADANKLREALGLPVIASH
jgi:5-(carboxyamino)imidazole ribonucleotide synthase